MVTHSRSPVFFALLGALFCSGLVGCGARPATKPDNPKVDNLSSDQSAPDAPTAIEKSAADAKSNESQPAGATGESAAPFSTPQATFDALRQAALAGDAQQIMACFTDDGAAEIVGAPWLLGAYLLVSFEGPDHPANEQALAAAIRQAYERHVPVELRLRSREEIERGEWPVDVDLSLPEDQVRTKVRAAARQFKEPEIFVATMLKAFDTFAKQTDPSDDGTTMKSSRLEDLRIEGDKAAGKVTKGLLDAEDVPIRFVRAGGVWKIETLGDYSISFGDTKKKSK